MFFSPASISIALAMTYAGARNDTAKEMKNTLGFSDLSESAIHSAFEQLLDALTAADAQYKLHVANRLFAEKCYQFHESFLSTVLTHYKAEATNLDFIKNAEASRLFVNEWVAKQTNDKIRDLLAPGVVDDMTRLILVNAVYFKGSIYLICSLSKVR